MELSILKRFGLNKNDLVVYEALFQLGRSKTGAIIESTSVSSSSVYSSLSNLVKQGLVSYQVKNNIKYYQAELPSQLIEDTRSQTSALEKLSKELTSLPISHMERNEVNVYQGMHGFKRAHEAMLREAKPGEDICVTAYSNYYGKQKQIRRFFHDMDKQLLNKAKSKIRMLVDSDLKKLIVSDRSSFVKKYQFRCLPRESFNPCGLNISDSMVIITVWGKTPIAFMLRNQAVIDSFRANFNLLWNMAKTK